MSKRMKKGKGDEKREAKRVKVDEVDCAEYELELRGHTYIDVDKLSKSPALKAYYNKRYKRSVQRLIEEENLDVIYATKKGVECGELLVKTSYAPRSDVRLVKKDANVERIIALAKDSSLDLAPPVITDDDIVFFVDGTGTRHQVEMRGVRTMESIYFKAKDMGRVFESDCFVDTIQHPHTSYIESVDFVWFTVLNPDNVEDKQRAARDLSDQELPHDSEVPRQDHRFHVRKQIFLTFAGFMHALHGTQSPVTREFRKWVYTQVFAVAYGTPEQKKAIVNQLCRVDKAFLQAFMTLVPNDIACLYLVDTTKREQGKKVYKFGRSEKLKERFYKHSAVFGSGTILDTVVFIPVDRLSEAEARLNQSVADSLRFAVDEARELLLLDTGDYKTVRTTMQTIADKYNGSMTVHATVLKSEMKDQEFQLKSETKDQALKYELRIKDLERMVEVLEGRVQHVAIEKEKKLGELLHQAELKLTQETSKAAAQLAEEKQKTATLQHQLETMELRIKVLQLEHAAQLTDRDRPITERDQHINEKDSRIAELEEVNRRLGTTFPEAARQLRPNDRDFLV